MRNWSKIAAVGYALVLIMVVGCSGDSSEPSKTADTNNQTSPVRGFHGWNTITIQNGYTILDVVPELGGKIMGYRPFGEQILWHHPTHTGEIAVFAEHDKGEPFINAGGAKVWPAPQNAWGGPPDRVLDGAPYEADFDGTTITVTSPPDTGEGRTGLTYNHRYSLQPQSSFVDLALGLTNNASESAEWALWHLATVPAKEQATIYVPVKRNQDWEVVHGNAESSQWLGVENGMFRARFNGEVGKVGMTVSEGWAVWHDEDRDIAFTLFFPIETGATYPHGGHQFEIWSTGDVTGDDGTVNPDLAYIELEALGPLRALDPQERTSIDIRWAACRCSDVRKVSEAGIVSEQFVFDGTTLTGKMGTFLSGTLIEFFYNESGNQVGRQRLAYVSPASEIVLRRSLIIPPPAVGLRYEIVNDDDEVIGVLHDLKLH